MKKKTYSRKCMTTQPINTCDTLIIRKRIYCFIFLLSASSDAFEKNVFFIEERKREKNCNTTETNNKAFQNSIYKNNLLDL